MSHYDSNVPGQYTPPFPEGGRPPRPPKTKVPLWAKLVAVFVGGPVVVVLALLAIIAGSVGAEEIGKHAGDPAPVVSTETPIPTATATKPSTAPTKTKDQRFTEQARAKYPELAKMDDATMIAVAKSACSVLEAGEDWESVVETIGESAKGSEAMVTGVIRLGVAVYCPKWTDRVTPGVKKPSKPTMTAAQEQAVGAAQDYLRVSSFSRAGLIDQLTSEYGSAFAKADAVFAVDYLKVDWNAQAVKAAKAYLRVTHFSRAGLIDQLESEYGGQFTHAQAVHGVTKAGL